MQAAEGGAGRVAGFGPSELAGYWEGDRSRRESHVGKDREVKVWPFGNRRKAAEKAELKQRVLDASEEDRALRARVRQEQRDAADRLRSLEAELESILRHEHGER